MGRKRERLRQGRRRRREIVPLEAAPEPEFALSLKNFCADRRDCSCRPTRRERSVRCRRIRPWDSGCTATDTCHASISECAAGEPRVGCVLRARRRRTRMHERPTAATSNGIVRAGYPFEHFIVISAAASHAEVVYLQATPSDMLFRSCRGKPRSA